MILATAAHADGEGRADLGRHDGAAPLDTGNALR